MCKNCLRLEKTSGGPFFLLHPVTLWFVESSVVDESSVPPKTSVFGRRELCPQADESSTVDKNSFSRRIWLL